MSNVICHKKNNYHIPSETYTNNKWLVYPIYQVMLYLHNVDFSTMGLFYYWNDCNTTCEYVDFFFFFFFGGGMGGGGGGGVSGCHFPSSEKTTRFFTDPNIFHLFLIRFCGIHLRAISQLMTALLFYIMSLKTVFLGLLTHLPVAPFTNMV